MSGYLVIVPSISDTTTKSVDCHTKMRAVHAMTPEADSENVMVLAPDFKFNDFYEQVSLTDSLARRRRHATYKLIRG